MKLVPGQRNTITQQTLPAIALALAAGAGITGAQSVGSVLDDLIEEQIQRRVESEVLDAVERQLESSLEKALEAGAGATAMLDGLTEILPGSGETFASELDATGQAVERGVLVVLTDPTHAARILDQGFLVRELRRLESLDRVLLRVEVRAEEDLAEAARRLALDAPAARIDFNHLYHGVEGSAGAGSASTTLQRRPGRAAKVTVGIVDTAVENHPAFRSAVIERKDFVAYDRPRPGDHGTAVASILVGDSPRIRGILRGAELHAASVFFEDSNGAPVATSTSLVQALDWLAGTGVRVINMSLAGPPNRILEAALRRVTADGAVIIAAVGNNGPVGAPLYPAAYEPVIGITAVDSQDQAYRYAARGPHVAFAAPGVGIAVARGDGGYGTKSGTSMAAPYAAAILARSLAGRGAAPDRVLPALQAMARDLGDAGFDETFGHGLLVPPD